jgi:hypothetical protein
VPRTGALSLAILAGGFLARILQYAGNRSLWLDEAMLARNIAARGPLELLAPLDYDQGAPALFLVLVDGVSRLLGTGEAALRLVPLAASLAGLVVFLLLARMLLDRRYVPIALFLFAFSTAMVYYAQELKQYSVDAAVAVTLAYLALRLVRAKTVRRLDLICLGAFGALAVFLSYPAVFVMAGVATVLALQKLRRRLEISSGSLALTVVAWGVAFAVSYAFFLRPLAGNQLLAAYWKDGFLPLPVSAGALKAWYEAGSDFLSFCGFFEEWRVLVFALAALALLAGLRSGSPGILMIGAAIPFALGASVAGKYPFSGRLAVFAVPLLILLAVKGLEDICRRRPVYVFIALTACLLVPHSYSLVTRVSRPMQREEVRPLLAYLDNNLRPEDRVYVYYWAEHAVKYYRPGRAYDERWHFGRSPFEDQRSLDPPTDMVGSRPRVWFLFTHSSREKEIFFLSRLEGTLLDKQEEHGARLYLYGKRNTGPVAGSAGRGGQ